MFDACRFVLLPNVRFADLCLISCILHHICGYCTSSASAASGLRMMMMFFELLSVVILPTCHILANL